MIPYEELCRALDRHNGRRRNADEMAQLDQVSVAPAPVAAPEPVYQDVAPQPVYQDAAPQPVYQDVAPQPVYQDVATEPVYQDATTEEAVAHVSMAQAPAPGNQQAPAVDAVNMEEPTMQAPLEMGSTDQIFTPGSELPYIPADTSANTAETAMPYLEQPTDVTPLQPTPQDPGFPEETTQEFDIEEAEEVLDKEPGA